MIPTVDDDEVFELTNIKVREVSLVDRAANQRKFVVTKREDKKRSGDPITAEDAAKALEKAQENFANTPAAELDRKDAEEAAKASAPAEAVEPVVESVNTVAVEAATVATISTETIAEPVEAVKADLEPSFATPATDAFAAKMQAAWLGAIDAVRGRLDMMSEEAKQPYGYPAGHIYYIKCMLECMYDIGGAEWDIESAAMSAIKSDDVTKREGLAKIGKAISARRVMSAQLTEMQKMFDALTTEPIAPVVVETIKNESVAASVAAVPVVAVVAPAPAVAASAPDIEAPAFDITKDPAFKALQDAMTSQTKTLKSLETIIGTQEKELAKARATVRSNALTPDLDTPHNEEVKWPLDMAATSKFRSR